MYCLSTFKKLTEEDQWNIFWEQAHFIAEHENPNASFMLYGIEDYFIEIQFDALCGNAGKIKAFIKGPRLDKYLKSIKLDLIE